VNDLWDNSISSNTKAVYASGLNQYRSFLEKMEYKGARDVTPPISEDILIQFIAYLHTFLHIQYSTIKIYLCGIRHHYIRYGLNTPLQSNITNVRIYSFLRSVKRKHHIHPTKRLPVDIEVLSKMISYLDKGCFGRHDDSLIKSCCTLGFFGFLRCGEFTIKDSFIEHEHLCLSDVIVSKQKVVVKLKTSKTDPFREGVNIHIHATGNEVCPVSALQNYLVCREALSMANETAALFLTNDGLPLSRSTFIHKLKFVLGCLGLDDKRFNGHSLRIGAATTCAKLRIEDHLIKTLGRWSSDCYTRYIRTDQSTVQAAQKAMSKIGH